MLNLECSYGNAHMTTLMRLVAIQMTNIEGTGTCFTQDNENRN